MRFIRSKSRSRRCAMTLLEVILAMTVLASISTLVAALWAQTRDWTLENASHQQALHVERAIALLDQQWRTRVLSVSLGDEDAPAVSLTQDTMSFVTTTPIAFHDAPMVRVAYRLERTGGYLVGETAVWSLQYAESPVTNPRIAVATAGATGGGATHSLTLLEDASSLQWERWYDPPLEQRAREEPRWIALAAGDELAVAAAVSTSNAGVNDLNAAAEASRAREELENPLRAGRLTGTVKGEPITWLFVAAPSR